MPGILIVDDHQAARITIRELLDWHGFQICGDENGKEAIERVTDLKPDIVLMDINMPVMNGLVAAGEIRRIAPKTKIVFLTIHEGERFKVGTKPWGHGFVAKSQAGTDLIPTLQRVAGITADEIMVDFPHCKVRQRLHIAKSTEAMKKARQYLSCINCGSEFSAKVRHKIVAGPFSA